MSAPADPPPSEATYMNELMLAMSRRLPVRCWRQNAGEFRLASGHFAKAAPKGAADITGVVRPEGWRLEVEVKGAGGRLREGQDAWAERCAEWGCVYALVGYDPTRPLAANVDRGVGLVADAIEARRARAGCPHPIPGLVLHPTGGVRCTRCGWWSPPGEPRR